ncbi:MAG: pyridoxine 5'-phosphate synthase, partial [Chitinophagales bacterium]|nr:pyridoxine 5'-phosphate synthase [Chitinophagales bacterium]
TTEFNIEGYPDRRYMDIIKKVKPAQATLVPDPPHVITSNTGWDVLHHLQKLKDIIAEIKSHNVRVSLFLNPDIDQVYAAKESGTDRIEFYTGPYAEEFNKDKNASVQKYIAAAEVAHKTGLRINAGHDLNLDNLKFFKQSVIHLDEVSIGHALISDALYFGIENTIQLYKRQLQ